LHFGVLRSATTTSRRPRGDSLGIVQRSVFRNSRMVTVGSSAAGLGDGAVECEPQCRLVAR
jgi:hypothetical protein